MANSHFPNAGGSGSPGGSANSVQYNDNGAFGGFGSWDGSTLTVGGLAATADVSGASVCGTAVAFAALPAVPVEGMLVAVTDSNTATWGATIAGGGSNHVLAYYNGTNWTVAGK